MTLIFNIYENLQLIEQNCTKLLRVNDLISHNYNNNK